MSISLREILEIYRDTIDGIRQQTLDGEFFSTMTLVPRDPSIIGRGIEAAFGIKFDISPADFYENLPGAPDHTRKFFSASTISAHNRVKIYISKGAYGDGNRYTSRTLAKFVILKEMFFSVIRKVEIDKGRRYPDTITFNEVTSLLLDMCIEVFSVYDFPDNHYAPTVKIENAAEVLAIMFLVDIGELYNARRALHVKPKTIWALGNGISELPRDSAEAQARFANFDYEAFADKYDVAPRVIALLVKTDSILVIVDSLKSMTPDLPNYFVNIIYAMYDYLAHAFSNWLHGNEIVVTEDARVAIGQLFMHAEAIQPALYGTEKDEEVRRSLYVFLDKARDLAEHDTIDKVVIERVLASLCPIWPFC